MIVEGSREDSHERCEEREAALSGLGGLVTHLLVECLDDGGNLGTEEREGAGGEGGRGGRGGREGEGEGRGGGRGRGRGRGERERESEREGEREEGKCQQEYLHLKATIVCGYII